MKLAIQLVAAAILLGVVFALGWLSKAAGVGQIADPGSLSERERAFTERMQNVVLVGHFTVEGRERRDGLAERYEIARVNKLEGEGNRWRFDARVQYMNVDVTLPVVVPVVWAGDTPMVSITDFDIPGLGEDFGARVIFYDDRYAGTWDHGEYGGLMYGTIEPLEGESSPES